MGLARHFTEHICDTVSVFEAVKTMTADALLPTVAERVIYGKAVTWLIRLDRNWCENTAGKIQLSKAVHMGLTLWATQGSEVWWVMH